MLERNPTYRDVRYDAEPAADDAEGQALLARFKGRRLPMIDRVEISIIEEEQPRWLSFVSGQHTLIEQVPPEFIEVAMPNGKVAPNLAKKGIQGYRIVRPDFQMILYNMDDPVLGGYTPDKVALRRALNLSYDVDREIRLVWRNQAIPAQSPLSRTPAAMTRSSRAKTASTARPRRKPCSIFSAMWTATATAGASGPTARRCC